jgi:hypothetical protein
VTKPKHQVGDLIYSSVYGLGYIKEIKRVHKQNHYICCWFKHNGQEDFITPSPRDSQTIHGYKDNLLRYMENEQTSSR